MCFFGFFRYRTYDLFIFIFLGAAAHRQLRGLLFPQTRYFDRNLSPLHHHFRYFSVQIICQVLLTSDRFLLLCCCLFSFGCACRDRRTCPCVPIHTVCAFRWLTSNYIILRDPEHTLVPVVTAYNMTEKPTPTSSPLLKH